MPVRYPPLRHGVNTGHNNRPVALSSARKRGLSEMPECHLALAIWTGLYLVLTRLRRFSSALF